MPSISRAVVGAVVLPLILCVLVLLPVSAVNITQEFAVSEQLAIGTIVSISDDKKSVQKTDGENLQKMYGVVANAGDIALAQGASGSTVSVASTGIISAIVSTAAGDIKTGDPITVRSIAGVGEKATRSGRVIGIAQAELTAQTSGVTQTTVTINGVSQEVYLGLLDIRVNASDYTPASA